MSALAIVNLLEAATNLAISFGINVQKYNAMRELSPTNKLSQAQREELAGDTRSEVEGM